MQSCGGTTTMNNYGMVDDPETGFYVDQWLEHHQPLWAMESQREELESYFGQFSGEDAYCIDCGEPTDDEYRFCTDCRTAQGDVWKGEIIGWSDGSIF